MLCNFYCKQCWLYLAIRKYYSQICHVFIPAEEFVRLCANTRSLFRPDSGKTFHLQRQEPTIGACVLTDGSERNMLCQERTLKLRVKSHMKHTSDQQAQKVTFISYIHTGDADNCIPETCTGTSICYLNKKRACQSAR